MSRSFIKDVSTWRASGYGMYYSADLLARYDQDKVFSVLSQPEIDILNGYKNAILEAAKKIYEDKDANT